MTTYADLASLFSRKNEAIRERTHVLRIEVERPEIFVQVCRILERAPVQAVETFSPVPPPGACGASPRSRLAWICLLAGLAGGGSKIFFQFWASAVAWPIDVGGRPWNSWPAFIPLTFEIFVLAAGTALVAAFFLRNRLRPGRAPGPEGSRAARGMFVVRCEVGSPPAEVRELVRSLKGLGARVFPSEAEKEEG